MAEDRSPSRRLLVPLDGSHLAEAALPLAQVLAQALDAQVVLLHVLEYHPPATIHGEPHLTTKGDAEGYLARVAAGLRATGLAVATHVHDDPQRGVADSIAAHAAELSADMIVICAHGRGGVREWLVGRIPQQVVARARRPVALVPAPTERDFAVMRRIMLPIDQEGEAMAALPMARRLAAAWRAEIALVTVVPTPETVGSEAGAATVFLPLTSASLLDWAEEQARNQLAAVADNLRQAGLVVTTEVWRGDVARALLQAIADDDADLVIMATHARAGWAGLWAGSVGPRIVGHTDRPVLLIPIKDE